jgi:hypothetical protein
MAAPVRGLTARDRRRHRPTVPALLHDPKPQKRKARLGRGSPSMLLGSGTAAPGLEWG